MDEPNAASVALIRAGEVLLIKRAFAPFKGNWTLPGGRREHGESIENCAIREVREETGLSVSQLQFVVTLAVSAQFRLAVFATTEFAGRIEASDEVADSGWVHPDALANYDTTPELGMVLERAFRLVAPE